MLNRIYTIYNIHTVKTQVKFADIYERIDLVNADYFYGLISPDDHYDRTTFVENGAVYNADNQQFTGYILEE